MFGVALIRIHKLMFSLIHPYCWKALWRGVAPSIEHRSILVELNCDLIVDVGANRGQFSLISRMVRPGLPIIAFEPIPSEAKVYRQVTAGFTGVQIHQAALGEVPGEADIHLSRSTDSSSLLPIGEKQKELFCDTEEIGTLRIPVSRLDDFKADWSKYSRVLLKIDVQGFELSVLRGATEALKHCAYVYVECSETELYVGQALYPEVAAFLKSQGFGPEKQLNEQFTNGRLVQADYLFKRSSQI